MQLEQFYLGCHSFGGFVCGNYATRYPQHIKKVLMLSPIGVRFDPEHENLTPKERTARSKEAFKGRLPVWAQSLAKSVWGAKVSPFSFARFVGRKRVLKGLDGFVKNRNNVHEQEQADAVRDYMYQIFMRPGTTEHALPICFDLETFLYCKLTPLAHEDRMANKEFPIPVSFFYGSRDWVLRVEGDAGKTVVEANSHAESQYHIVNHSDHNMHMDNPIEFAHLIINDVFPNANLPTGIEPQDQFDYEEEFME